MTRSHVLAVAVGMIFIASTASFAAPGPTVRVRFDIKSTNLDGEWGSSVRADVIANVRKGLVRALKEALPHWEFSADDSAGPSGGPALLFHIIETSSGGLFFRLTLPTPGVPAPALVDEDWLKLPDILAGGYPQPDSAAGQIVGDVTTLILVKHAVELRTWLSQFVAIAVGAHWLGPQPRLVLALPWDRYDALRHSSFRVICDWPGQGRAEVLSTGVGIAEPYRPLPPDIIPNPPFDGLMVIVNERDYGGTRIPVSQLGPELFDLMPRAVFLKEYIPPSEWSTGG